MAVNFIILSLSIFFWVFSPCFVCESIPGLPWLPSRTAFHGNGIARLIRTSIQRAIFVSLTLDYVQIFFYILHDVSSRPAGERFLCGHFGRRVVRQ